MKDDGPGISVRPVLGHNVPFLELAFTNLSMHGNHPYHVMGMAGVGAKCVNAISEWMIVNTRSGEEEFEIRFARGKVQEPLRKVIESKIRGGTLIHFKPDPEIFSKTAFDCNALAKFLEQVAFLHPGLDVNFVDEGPNQLNRSAVSRYVFPNGGADYLKLILPKETAIHPQEPVQFAGKEGGIRLSVAFQFNESINTWILSFVNSSQSVRDGTHVTGFLLGLTDAVNQFAGSRQRFQPHEVRIGLSAIVSVWLADPKYGRATKSELINQEVEQVVRKLTFEKVRAWIAEIQGADNWFIDRIDEQRSPNFGL